VDGKVMIVKLEQDENQEPTSCMISSFKLISFKDEHPEKH
jgi:hypothetical protein